MKLHENDELENIPENVNLGAAQVDGNLETVDENNDLGGVHENESCTWNDDFGIHENHNLETCIENEDFGLMT